MFAMLDTKFELILNKRLNQKYDYDFAIYSYLNFIDDSNIARTFIYNRQLYENYC